MKKIAWVLLSVVTISCTMTENIYITDAGSGHYTLEMDGSQLMSMIPDGKMSDNGEMRDIDTTIVFKHLLVKMKDSIEKLSPDRQQRMKAMENFTMNIRMKAAQKQMMFTMASDFKNLDELGNMMRSVEDAQKQGLKGVGPEKAEKVGSGFGANAAFVYKFDGKEFSRKVTAPKDVVAVNSDSLQMYNMIYESLRYIVKYHFPKPVKKVSDPKALYSDDRKMVSVEYPMGEYVKNPELSNLEVDFE